MLHLEKSSSEYKVSKSGKKYQVCKVLSTHDTEDEAMQEMLKAMKKETRDKE